MKHGNTHAAPTEIWFAVILASINMPPLTGFILALLSPTSMELRPSAFKTDFANSIFPVPSVMHR